jgi:uncharacterized membrane protein
MSQTTFERAIKLAAVSGLKAALGPALLAASRNRPEAKMLAIAAMGEMVIDKLPYVPSRSSWPLLIPRAASGAYVANELGKEDPSSDPWIAAVGAAVAVGVGTFAPIIRGTLTHVLGVPNALVGVAEDYLALKLGAEAVGMDMDRIGAIAKEAVGDLGLPVDKLYDEVADQVRPILKSVGQSVGAGSM